MTSIWTVVFAFALVAISLSLMLYFSKSKREREKETNTDIVLRAALPSIFIAMIFVYIVFQSSIRTFRFPRFGKQTQQTYLNEPFDSK